MYKAFKFIFFSLFLLSCLGVKSELIAQNTFTFDTTFFSPEQTLHELYEFQISKKDTIRNGNYHFYNQTLTPNNFHKYVSAEGLFKGNHPHGLWTLKQGEFQPTLKNHYENYLYAFQVHASELKLTGRFNNGKKTGEWVINNLEIRNSQIQDTSLTASFTFENDQINGAIRFRNEDKLLVGQLSNNGLTEGTWTFSRINEKGMTPPIKEWKFEDNSLKSIRLYLSDTVQEFEIYTSKSLPIIYEELPLNDDFLEIIRLKALIQNQVVNEKLYDKDAINDLYFQLLQHVKLADKHFSKIINSTITPNIKTKLPTYPLSDQEESLLDEITKGHEFNSSEINNILNDPPFKIACLSAKKMSNIKDTLIHYQTQVLSPSQELLSMKENQELRYFNRNDIIAYKLKLDIVRSLDTSQTNNQDVSNMEKWLASTLQLKKELDSIKTQIELHLQEVEQEKDLAELETNLFTTYRTTKKLADSLITGEHDNFAGINVAQSIINFVDNQLKLYSNIPTSKEKINSIENFINCFMQTQELIRVIYKAPESIYNVNDKYTKEFFNPYTYTNMEEKAKPSIYKAFNRLLLPAIFQNLQSLSCENMMDFQNNFIILNSEMLRLLDEENTNKIERKVKRVNSAKEAAEILGMNLSFDE